MQNLFKFLFLTFLIILNGECSSSQAEQTVKNTDEKEIITNIIREKDGTIYLPNDTKPFTGKYVEFYPSGQKFREYPYKNGYFDTDNISQWDENGQKIQGGNNYQCILLNADSEESIVTEKRNGITYLPNTDVPYTGKWEVFHSNGKIRTRRNFVNGKQDGAVEHWFSNGQKSSSFMCKNGEINGLSISWYDNGQKNSENNYKDGVADGKTIFWYENGANYFEKNYKNGIENGVRKQWERNGYKTIRNYVDGLQNGTTTMWNENGRKVAEFHYTNGKKNGLETHWGENGYKKSEIHHTDGRENGLASFWNEDGSKKGENHYKNGELIHTKQKSSVETEGSSVFALSLDDKLSAWRTTSYSEQAKMCESIANALKKPTVTAPDLCIYLSEMSSGGEADFMKISQLAALYATVAK